MSRSTRIAVGASALMVVFSGALDAGDKNAKKKSPFEVVSLQINRPVQLDGEKGSKMLLGSGEGTIVSVICHRPEGGILELDRRASKLESFTDSAGNDIFLKPRFGGPFSMTNQISKDKKKLLFQVTSSRLPEKGATGVHAKGTLVLKVASTKGKASKKNAKLTKGAKTKVGTFELSVSTAGKSQFFDDKYEVQFESKQDLTTIASLRFLDSKGKEIPSEAGGSGHMSFNNDSTWTQTYRLDKAVKRASIEIEYWKDAKTIQIPFDLEVGVGL